jgi:hypothetical protein
MLIEALTHREDSIRGLMFYGWISIRQLIEEGASDVLC